MIVLSQTPVVLTEFDIPSLADAVWTLMVAAVCVAGFVVALQLAWRSGRAAGAATWRWRHGAMRFSGLSGVYETDALTPEGWPVFVDEDGVYFAWNEHGDYYETDRQGRHLENSTHWTTQEVTL